LYWDYHQENISILGMQGSGKTTKAHDFLDTIPNTPRLIISPQRPMKLYGQYGNPIYSVKEIVQGGAFVWNSTKPNEKMFNQICKKVMTLKNMVMVVDDAHEFCKKQKIPEEWDTLINSGRNRGITSIFISPSPNLLNNTILQSSQHLISYSFVLESQIEYARKNFFGDIGYLLLFRPARPYKYKKYPQLEKHDYLHRFVGDDFVTWTDSRNNETQLKSISDLKQTNQIVEDDTTEDVEQTDTETIEDDTTEDVEQLEQEDEEID